VVAAVAFILLAPVPTARQELPPLAVFLEMGVEVALEAKTGTMGIIQQILLMEVEG
jgi:hypothetical protein